MSEDKSGIINTMIWLEESDKEKIHSDTKRCYLITKTNMTKMKWAALADMYESIDEAEYSRDNVLTGLAKLDICFKMGLIPPRIHNELLRFLENKL